MSDWLLQETRRGGRYLVCPDLREAGLPHAFTLRPTAGAPLYGRRGPPEELAAAIGLQEMPVARPVQVHGAVVGRPSPDGRGTDPRRADAVVVRGARRCAAVATADCVAGVLFAPGRSSFAVFHAGWRGTLAGAIENTIGALANESGADPASFVLAIGPSIGPCCYEIGEEVAARYRAAFPQILWQRLFGERDGRATLDIGEANRLRAGAAGLHPERVFSARICTACRTDLCCSYRVEGPAAGRMWAVAGIPG